MLAGMTLYTADQVEISPGLVAWDYDFDLIIVPPIEADDKQPHVDYGQPEDKAWFDVIKMERGGMSLMNGERLLAYALGKSAFKAAKAKHLVVEKATPPNCDICWFAEGQIETPAIGDFKTNQGPWANVCRYHWLHNTLHEAGTGKGQFFVVEV